MDDILNNMKYILDTLEDRLTVLKLTMEKADEVPLKFDEFNIISQKISMLEKLLEETVKYRKENDKNYLSELCASLAFTINHLNRLFSNKESISSTEINGVIECLNKINNIKGKINDNTKYGIYFSELKNISRKLKGVNDEKFLKNSNKTKSNLEMYEKILINLESIIGEIDKIRDDMPLNDFKNLKQLLEENYKKISYNFKQIYWEILNTNSDIPNSLLNKQKINFVDGNYSAILNDSMIYKLVYDDKKREELINAFDVLIEELDEIINRYKDCKVDKSKIRIDIDISDEVKKKDHDLDIDDWVNSNYKKHREEERKDEGNKYKDRIISDDDRRLKKIESEYKSKPIPKEILKLYYELKHKLKSLNGSTSGFVNDDNQVFEDTKKRK